MGLLSTIGAASGRAFGLTRVGAAIRDAYFNLTTLLLPGNGTNGAQNNTFLDSSSNNFTITRNGNTTQGTFSPFSQTGWSNFFNGSSDYLSFSDNAAFELGSGDFTLEAWVNFSALPASNGHQATIFSKWGGGTSQSYELYLYNNAGTQQLYFTYSLNSTTSTNVGVNWTPTVGVWYHVACVRSGSNLYFFVNGTQQGSTGAISGTIADNASTLQIGTFNNTANTFLNGYLSSARMTKGGALYTNTFTPSTTPLTTTVSAGTVSLLTCQSNRFIDNSSNAFAITVNGTPSVQAFSPFAPTAAYSAATVGGSGYFDGSGDYLTASSATAVGSGSFCFEAWIYPTNASAAQMILGNPTTGGMWIGLNIDGANRFAIGRVATVIDNIVSYTWTNNQWHHIAVNRDGTSLQFFVNGTQVGSTATNSINYSTAGRMIGGEGAGTALFTGYISGWRFVNASTYTTTFTVPTAPPTAITNTSLLCNFTNAGITDATAKNVLETVGNAQISTTQSKFGGSSMYFDGSGDYLVSPNIYVGDFLTGDFTIEYWFRCGTQGTSYVTQVGTLDSSSGANSWRFGTHLNTTAGVYFSYHNGSGFVDVTFTTTNYNDNAWHHAALTRSGSTVRAFIDGTQVGSNQTISTSFSARRVVVGAELSNPTYYTGYIDDLRITKGYARYTSNFTAPTAAFPTQ